ncbi:unnamed protein product, partial [Aphanomyces euteiches]
HATKIRYYCPRRRHDDHGSHGSLDRSLHRAPWSSIEYGHRDCPCCSWVDFRSLRHHVPSLSAALRWNWCSCGGWLWNHDRCVNLHSSKMVPRPSRCEWHYCCWYGRG